MKVRLDFQTEVDILNQSELDASLSRANDAAARAFLAGIESRPLPPLRGIPSGAALSLGTTDPVGPRQGYAWSITRLAVSGLTSGATPDTVQFAQGIVPLWQLDGTMPFEKFGRLQLVLRGGQTLTVANVGAITATGQIVVSGEIIEVPELMLGKLA